MKKIKIAQIGVNANSHSYQIFRSIEKQKDEFEIVGYVLPENEVYFQGKRVKEPRNTPLLLPRIVERISEIKGVSVSEAEQVTCENARRLFDIPEKGE